MPSAAVAILCKVLAFLTKTPVIPRYMHTKHLVEIIKTQRKVYQGPPKCILSVNFLIAAKLT